MLRFFATYAVNWFVFPATSCDSLDSNDDHNRDFDDNDDDDDGDICSDDDNGDDNDVDADAGIHQISAALEFPADLLSIVGLEVPFHILNCISLVKKATRMYLSCIW